MEFAKLDFITPSSHLQSYYAMHFEDFNEDFKKFEEKVIMEARLQNTIIDTDDLTYFAPDTKTWNRKIGISGNAKGTLGNVVIKNLFLKAGNSTIISGDLAMFGLPDINSTVFDLTSGEIVTTYRDAVNFLPDLAEVETPSISSLGNVRFRGSFNGTINNFNTNGVFSTNLGGLTANVSMSLPAKGLPEYKGQLATQRFDVGRFLRIKDLGAVTFNGTVKGVGLTVNSLKTSVVGNIGQLAYNDYNYKRINVEGTFQKKQFDGSIKIDDQNLNFFTTVKMDFRGAQPQFNVLGDLANSDFQKLNLSDKKLQISGLFDLNFSGKNIDQFLGSVKIFNANLVQDSVRLNFDSLSLQSGFQGGTRTLALTSNEFDASIIGKYNILDLPNTFQTFLHEYYPAYIKAPRTNTKSQQFTFVVNTKNIEGYTSLVSKDIKGFSYSSITGTINTIDTVFEMNADIPFFAINRNRFNNISFTGRGNLDVLQLNGNIENIWMGDSTGFPNTTINIVSQKDQSSVKIKTKANSTLNELNLNAELFTFPDGIKINFNPSDFVINDKRWVLEKEGELVIRKNFVSAENVRFTQNEQEIRVETTHDEEFDKSNLLVKLRNINIGDFAPLVLTDPRLEGLLSGEVEMKDFYGKFKVEANLQASQFRIDNDSVGLVTITGGYSATTERIGFAINSANELYNFTAKGSYSLADSTGSPLLTSIKLDNTKINILNKFLGTIFSNIEGFATGELSINGNPSKPQLLGSVTLKRGSLLVNFTQVNYTVDSATLSLLKMLLTLVVST
jgi:hypothetical protein